MYHILDFSRNRSTYVEQADDNTLISYCRLNDFLMDACVKITVTLPNLEITDVEGTVFRPGSGEFKDCITRLARAKGIRIGPSVLKIIKGLVGEDISNEQPVYMLEECCHAVVLAFTKEDLKKSPAPEDEDDSIRYHRQMVIDNIRMYNRCAAFAPGSRIVDGIKI